MRRNDQIVFANYFVNIFASFICQFTKLERSSHVSTHDLIFLFTTAAAKIMPYEWLHVWLNFVERNIIYPAVFLSALTSNAGTLVSKFGP